MNPNESSPSFLPPARILLKNSFRYYKEHWRALAPVLTVLAIFQFATALWKGPTSIGVLLFVLSFLASIFVGIIFIGILAGGWDMREGIPALFRKSCAIFFSWASTNAYAVLAIIGGFFLLVIPGLYISMLLSFVSFVFFAENKRGVAALLASAGYVRGHFWSVTWRFVFFGLFAGITQLLISGIIVGRSLSEQFMQLSTQGMQKEITITIHPLAQLVDIGFQSFVLLPIAAIYALLLYQILRALKQESVRVSADEEKIQKTIQFFMRVGMIGLILAIVASGFFILYTIS